MSILKNRKTCTNCTHFEPPEYIVISKNPFVGGFCCYYSTYINECRKPRKSVACKDFFRGCHYKRKK